MRGAGHRLGARCSRRGAPASRSSPPITAPMARSVRSRPPITASWRSGDRVIANSRYTAAVIEARAPRAKDRIRVIYRGVDRNVFDPAAVDAQEVDDTQGCLGRSSRHQDRAPCRAAHQHQGAARPDRRRGARQCRGRARQRCGHSRRRRAWTRRLSRGADLGLIARHGLGDKVRLVGHCREMPAAYLASQVAVTTSTVPETFGRTSAEAQAMGCPVIVPDLGALPETIVASGARPDRVYRMAVSAARHCRARKPHRPGACPHPCRAGGNRRPRAGRMWRRISRWRRCKSRRLPSMTSCSAAISPKSSSAPHQQTLAPEVQTTGDTTPFQHSV